MHPTDPGPLSIIHRAGLIGSKFEFQMLNWSAKLLSLATWNNSNSRRSIAVKELDQIDFALNFKEIRRPHSNKVETG